MKTDSSQKRLSLGVSDFKNLMEWNGYYVDKTLMIRDLIKSNEKITIFVRPRIFGKTLNLSMLRRFFEYEISPSGERIDNGYLFDTLKIKACGEDILKHQQQYPVVSLCLTSAKKLTFEAAQAALVNEVCKEMMRHLYVLQSDALLPDEKERYSNILRQETCRENAADILSFLSACLAKYHGRKTVILIDEYEVPLENAYARGFYDEMLDFMRRLFESGIMKNQCLEKCVMTGSLRINTEDVFGGVDSLAVESISSLQYSEYFGFTDAEIRAMLEYLGVADKYEEMKEWYGGYYFGNTELYNPWGVINYAENLCADNTSLPRMHWGNSSSKVKLIRRLVEIADRDKTVRQDLEALISGETIKKWVQEEISLSGEPVESTDYIWNMLLLSGYTTTKEIGKLQAEKPCCLELRLPNSEIKTIYSGEIETWTEKKIRQTDRSAFVHALECGDCQTISKFIQEQLCDIICPADAGKSYYIRLLGKLLINNGYRVNINAWNETSAPSVSMQTPNYRKGRAIVLEVDVSDTESNMGELCAAGLKRIETNHYAKAFEEDGYPKILKYAISFHKKNCMVRAAEDHKR